MFKKGVAGIVFLFSNLCISVALVCRVWFALGYIRHTLHILSFPVCLLDLEMKVHCCYVILPVPFPYLEVVS